MRTVPVRIGLDRLSVEDVIAVAREERPVAGPAEEIKGRLDATASWVARTVEEIAAAREQGDNRMPIMGSIPASVRRRAAPRSTAPT